MKELKTYYRRHLPHYQPLGYTYFVTFRLTDSLPGYIIQKLKDEKEAFFKKLSAVKNEREKSKAYYDYHVCYFEKFDKQLNKYKESPHWLGQNEVAAIVKEAIHFRDGKEYDLIAYTIMPNHVHMVFTPLFEKKDIDNRTKPGIYLVTEILQWLKWYTAKECNKVLNRSGDFWQHENYDHIIRNEEELDRIVEYVLNNPLKADLTDNWEDWEWSYCKYL